MKKSRSIPLTLMAGLAAAACGDDASDQSQLSVGDGAAPTASADWGAEEESRHCADSTGRVVADEECARPRPAGVGYPFLWYYGARTLMGSGGATYVTGGRPSAVGVGTGTVPPRAGVTRGGFGSSARPGSSVGRVGRVGG